MTSQYSIAPPVGEEVHLPQPSIIPLVNAVAVSVAILGLTTSLVFTAVGGFVFLISLFRWLKDIRQNIEELPARHS